MDIDNGQAVKLWVAILIAVLFLCSIIFYIRLVIVNKKSKYLLKLLMLIVIGFPISLIVFNVYQSILNKFNISQSMNHNYKLYFFMINILGILGYIIYRTVLHIYKKKAKIKIYLFMLDINIIFNLFILIFYILAWIKS